MPTPRINPPHSGPGGTARSLVASMLLLMAVPPAAYGEEADAPTFTTRELESLASLPKIPKRQKRAAGEIAFAIFSFGKNGEDYFYLRNEKPEKILFNTGVVRRFQFGGEKGRVVIYKQSLNEEGEPILLPVAHVTPPTGSRDGIVLFRPKKTDGTKKVRRLPFINLSKDSFRPNDIRLVNMTSQPLVVQLNDKQLKLSPMEDMVRSQRGKAVVYPVKVGMISNDEVKIIYSNVFQAEPKNRTLFMIVPDWMNSSAGSPVRCMIYKDSGAVSG